MKHLAPYAMLLLCLLMATPGFSQTPPTVKPRQFNSYPGIINCTEAELDKVFSMASGQLVNLSFSDNFSFGGDIISKVTRYSNLQSAVVKSPTFNNTIFNITKRINPDNSVTYVGHIINKNYYDGYELKRKANGIYQLIKFDTDKVLQDCRQQ